MFLVPLIIAYIGKPLSNSFVSLFSLVVFGFYLIMYPLFKSGLEKQEKKFVDDVMKVVLELFSIVYFSIYIELDKYFKIKHFFNTQISKIDLSKARIGALHQALDTLTLNLFLFLVIGLFIFKLIDLLGLIKKK